MSQPLRFLAAAVVLLCSSTAYAQIDVRMGGYLDFTAGAFDSEFRENLAGGDDLTNRDFYVNTEIYVRATGKQDGWQYGAEIQLQNGEVQIEGESQNSATIDEAFIFLRSDRLGRLILGDDDGASRVLAVYAPLIESYGFDQTEGSYALFLLGNPVGMKAVNTFDSTKITYISPNMSGFRFGASYTPEYDEAQNVLTDDTGGTGRFGYQDWIEGGINYSQKFGDFRILLGATTVSASAREDSGSTAEYEDFWAWQVGAKLEWGNWAIGGGYVDDGDYRREEGVDYGGGYDFHSWNAGISYEAKQFSVAFSYQESEDSVFSEEHKVYGGGAIYKLFPGFQLQGDVIFVDADDADSTGSSSVDFSEDGWVVLLGTHMDF